MVLDERALENMLARQRASEHAHVSRESVRTEQTDEFEVYERANDAPEPVPQVPQAPLRAPPQPAAHPPEGHVLSPVPRFHDARAPTALRPEIPVRSNDDFEELPGREAPTEFVPPAPFRDERPPAPMPNQAASRYAPPIPQTPLPPHVEPHAPPAAPQPAHHVPQVAPQAPPQPLPDHVPAERAPQSPAHPVAPVPEPAAPVAPAPEPAALVAPTPEPAAPAPAAPHAPFQPVAEPVAVQSAAHTAPPQPAAPAHPAPPQPVAPPPAPAPEPAPVHEAVPEPAPAQEPAPAPAPVQEPAPEAPRRPQVWPPIRPRQAPGQATAQAAAEAPVEAPAAPEAAPQEAEAPVASAQTALPTEPKPRTHAPTVHAFPEAGADGSGRRIALVQAKFNAELTDQMASQAAAHAEKTGAIVSHHVTVPGVYDLPLTVQQLARRKDVDGVVVIGVVVQGETKHDELITFATAKTLQEISLATDTPIGLGIIGPGMTWEQAEARVGNGVHAVEAVLVQLAAL